MEVTRPEYLVVSISSFMSAMPFVIFGGLDIIFFPLFLSVAILILYLANRYAWNRYPVSPMMLLLASIFVYTFSALVAFYADRVRTSWKERVLSAATVAIPLAFGVSFLR